MKPKGATPCANTSTHHFYILNIDPTLVSLQDIFQEDSRLNSQTHRLINSDHFGIFDDLFHPVKSEIQLIEKCLLILAMCGDAECSTFFFMLELDMH